MGIIIIKDEVKAKVKSLAQEQKATTIPTGLLGHIFLRETNTPQNSNEDPYE